MAKQEDETRRLPFRTKVDRRLFVLAAVMSKQGDVEAEEYIRDKVEEYHAYHDQQKADNDKSPTDNE